MPRRPKKNALPAGLYNFKTLGRPHQDELGSLGAREEPERDECRPQPRRHVHRSTRLLVEACRVPRPWMCEAELSRAPQRKRDLAVVHVAGEDDVEHTR